ncbi:MAG: YitT family protein [Bacteroidales bacterium]|nr:YitT family protein [Bacteroidales bacterium]
MKILKEYLVMTLGVLIFSAAWGCFMIPNGMSSGGLTGLCTVLQYATRGLVKVGVSYGVLNVILLAIAFLVMGARFGIKTIYCIALSSVALGAFPYFEALHSVPGNFLYVPERFLIPVLSGVMEGVGLGLLFRQGGSSGGSDILAMIINKYWPVSPGRFFLVTDSIIVLSLMLLPEKTFSDLVYGFIMVVTSATIVDLTLMGGKSTIQVMVFSEKYEDIADYIIEKLNRGVTALNAVGWFTKNDKKVLLIIMQQKQLYEVTSVIKELDCNAFISVTPANSVYGEGFEEIKSGIKIKRKNGKRKSSGKA